MGLAKAVRPSHAEFKRLLTAEEFRLYPEGTGEPMEGSWGD